MTLAEVLRRATNQLAALEAPEIDNPRVEAELLLQHVLALTRAQLYQRLRDQLPADKEHACQDVLRRRSQREPTAYIIGHQQFYGIELKVTPVAPIPRPETELLVEEALALAGQRLQLSGPLTIVDVGTGCGAIALALATHLASARVIATDVSPAALALAQGNAQELGLASRLRFLCGDLLAPLQQRVDIIVANLPYVRSADWEGLPPEIRCHEPRQALDGGPDGLRVIKRLLRQAPAHLRPGGALLLEIGYDQGPPVQALASQAFPRASVRLEKDLASLDRVVIIQT